MVKAAIRVDASAIIGSGHVMRCLTLAKALRLAGADVTFVCRNASVKQIETQGFRVVSLPRRKGVARGRRAPYAQWLGATSKQDAADTIKALDGQVDLLVVDHYGIGAKWHKSLRSHAKSIMVIDDLADRKYDCDLLLDQGFLGPSKGRYEGRVPDKCRVLLGPKFALLQPEFRRERNTGCIWDEHVHKVFISFGGSDRGNETGKAIEAALSLGGSLRVTAVLGESNRRYSGLQERFGRSRLVSIVRNPVSMVGAMLHSDLAIGAPGMTTWERACLGIPSVLMALAENQEPIGRAVQDAGVALYLGRAETVTTEGLSHALQALVLNPDVRCDMASKAMKLVDGQGVDRVMGELCGRSML